MAERTLETLIDGGTFFEGPRWHDGRWWVSDFYRHLVLSISEDGTDVDEVLEVPGQPSGLGWLPDGSMVVTSMLDQHLLRRAPDGEVTVLADVSPYCGGLMNDLVTDAAGHTYVGDFGFDFMAGDKPVPTSIKRVDPDGTVTIAAEDLKFPNGSVVTPDGSTLIVGESYGGCYTAFTIQADGTLTDRRTWAQAAISPDGCALDADGRIWSADPLGQRCALVQEGGEIVDEVRAPDGMNIFACMLGGTDGRTLLLCCAPDFQSADREAAHDAKLLTTQVDTPHAGLP